MPLVDAWICLDTQLSKDSCFAKHWQRILLMHVLAGYLRMGYLKQRQEIRQRYPCTNVDCRKTSILKKILQSYVWENADAYITYGDCAR